MNIALGSRGRFTEADFRFVVRTLARDERNSVSLVELLSDGEMRDEILDHEKIFHELLSKEGCLKVSATFYFYILTRHVLKHAGIDDRELADYIAAVLAYFCNRERLHHPYAGTLDKSSYPYISDMLLALQKSTPRESFTLRIHIANFSLFLSGIFADRIAVHARRRGGPDITFYEQIGEANYRHAAGDRHAREVRCDGIFSHLADDFCRIRRSLNILSSELMQIQSVPQEYLIWKSGE